MPNASEIYLHAIKLLARQDYSCQGLRNKLAAKNFDSAALDAAIKLLTQKGLLNDNKFMRNKVINLMQKNYSPDYIYTRLIAEISTITPEFIIDIFQEHQVTCDSQICKVIEKKRTSCGETFATPVKYRILRHLIAKGHDPDLVAAQLSLPRENSY